MTIKGTTQLLGVIGHPVKHSMSPVMHNAAIATLGLDYVYLPFPIAPEQLRTAIDGFAAIGLQGFNITIPHKQTIMPLLSEVSDVARAIGAVNTVWWSDRGWCGTNTDALGFMGPLKSLQPDLERTWSQTPAIILGNGGAARAVVAACQQLGCPKIWVVGRSAEKLAAFANSWPTPPPNLSVHLWTNLDELLPQAGLVVNSTPVGMAPNVDASPLSPDQIARLPDHAIAYDLIYTPRPTLFLQRAIDRELIAIDGLEMLVQQGAAALEIWTQQTPPVDVMRQALCTYLTLN
ncbi:shikimate dehydrogenase [Leptolyngbya cf. ectocarpi LEGE 11479]|uniref:Shikimate dehydrogenase (NADP(+)) n=1 Tax=Leptolyngbya cf. ectocarpi LEGE 11479 TaxID=1828722 RepID=A0A928ZS94_LEPEC|nr:shikimate dehydrogenase [Leptolyngbya ectocarpi]MBE9065847.1 shikimate dehydrogenase [Leptolyngbya cf. ectocarpi LEGE 11479]